MPEFSIIQAAGMENVMKPRAFEVLMTEKVESLQPKTASATFAIGPQTPQMTEPRNCRPTTTNRTYHLTSPTGNAQGMQKRHLNLLDGVRTAKNSSTRSVSLLVAAVSFRDEKL